MSRGLWEEEVGRGGSGHRIDKVLKENSCGNAMHSTALSALFAKTSPLGMKVIITNG